jgi:hypothetical protein
MNRIAARGQLLVNLALLAAAFGFWLLVTRHLWFVYDEWSYFTYMQPQLEHGDLGQFLWSPYINHWSTALKIDWAVIYRLVGLASYRAYQLPTLAFHLALVVLLRHAIVRAGTNGWVATLGMLPLLFTGAGAGDVIHGWQVQFLGSLLFGTAQLLLSDHEGPVDRRDLVGLACGLASLLWGAVALTMAGVVALNLLLRGRWAAIAVGVLPLVAIFACWWVTYGHVGAPVVSGLTVKLLPGYVGRGLEDTFNSLFGLGSLGLWLALGGLAAAAATGVSPVAPRQSVLWALAFGALAFYVETALGRDPYQGPSGATASRYEYVAIALTLPLLVTAAGRLLAWRPLIPAAAALLTWSLAINLVAAEAYAHAYVVKAQKVRRAVNQLAVSPSLARLDPTRPVGVDGTQALDIGTVRRLHERGQLPA